MKRKSKNIEKVFLNILNNKISLYLVSLIAILVIINNLMNNNYVEVFIFYVIAGLVFLYTKNMTLILLVSLIGSCIFSNYKKVIFKEGFKENMEENDDYNENLGKNFHIDGDGEGYNHDYSKNDTIGDDDDDDDDDDNDNDDNDDNDDDSDNEENFEAFKNAKMYEGYAGCPNLFGNLDKGSLNKMISGAIAENNGYLDNSLPKSMDMDNVHQSIWTGLKRPLNFPRNYANSVEGKITNGDYLPGDASIKNFRCGTDGFEGFKEGAKAQNFGRRMHATVDGVPYPTGVGWSQELDDFNEYNKEVAKNTIEGFKEGLLKGDKAYIEKRAKDNAIEQGSAAASESLNTLKKNYEKEVRTVEKGIRQNRKKKHEANALAHRVRKEKGERNARIKRKMINGINGFDNSRPLDYSKIKHKKPINTRPQKTLTKGDEMEAAYDNFEKIMGTGNINSLGETTQGLISKQKELLNGIKDMTPVINEAMGVLNKFDLGSILGGIKK